MNEKRLAYGRPHVDDTDVMAVTDALRSGWLTTGPRVSEFEEALRKYTGAQHAVAVSSGTAALHLALLATSIGPGDEVIVPAMTFVATPNSVLLCGAIPVFADVYPDTLLLDIADVIRRISPRTRAIIAVDYAGQPCDYFALRSIAQTHKLWLIADACHSLGGALEHDRVGTLADITCFSFHPMKSITTGEGGAIVTQYDKIADALRMMRSHGLSNDKQMLMLGYNYRLSDIQCALGISQLRNLLEWIHRRQHLANIYDEGFHHIPDVAPLDTIPDVVHARHLYVLRVSTTRIRDRVITALSRGGVDAVIHYMPPHMHPYYEGLGVYDLPVAEDAYDRIMSLPLHQGLTDDNVKYVIDIVTNELEKL